LSDVRSRLAGRLLTGPFAFLAAGLIDFVGYLVASLWRSLGCGARSQRSV
jgi:hypothetical protein